METIFYNSVILAGIVQGVIFGAVVLNSKKYSKSANVYLAALVLVFTFNIFQYFLNSTLLISSKQFYDYLYVPVASLLPVLLFFYVNKSMDARYKITARKKLFYLPFIVFLAIATVYKLISALGGMNQNVYGFFEKLLAIQAVFSIIYIIILLSLIYKLVISHEKIRGKQKDNKILIELKWLKITLHILLLLFIFWTVLVILFLIDSENKVLFKMVWLGITLVIYWIGYVGLHKGLVVSERKNIREYSRAQISFSIVEKETNAHISGLESLMNQQKIFLDNKSSLESVAGNLKISTGHLSRTIKKEMGISFTEYINNLRVKEAQKYLLNPDFKNYTLIAIGLEAGFSSKSAFYASFKKATGLTPLQFKKTHENKS